MKRFGRDVATSVGAAPSEVAPRGRFAAMREQGSPARRATTTIIDQGFASASNFAVGIVVARIAGPAGLGAYAVAYSVWLVLAAVHRSLVTEPMSIESDVRRDDAAPRIRAGLAAELELGTGVGVLVAVVGVVVIVFGQRNVGIALLTLAPFLPFLLAQDYWRWVGFMQARPNRALANDTVFNTVQAFMLVVLIMAGLRSPSVAIAAWGIGAIAGTLYGLRQFSVFPTFRGGLAMASARWQLSKFLLAGSLTAWGSTQAYPILAGQAIGSAALGGLKAAQALVSGPSMVLAQAAGSIGLPEAATALEDGGFAKMHRVSLFVMVANVVGIGLFAAAVLVAAPQLLSWIYGPEFAQYAPAARIIAVAFVIQTFGTAGILVLKTTRQTHLHFRIGVAMFTVSAISTVAFSYWWGVNGTASAMVLSALVGSSLYLGAERRTAREYATADPARGTTVLSSSDA